MTRFLLVVFDGLRPDMVGQAATPNIQRFAAIGMRFARARSVFPSETRVCSSSVATGCLPRRHGLVGNRIAHPGDATRSVDTGLAEILRALEQETGAPVLDVPVLAEHLAVAGEDCVVLSSGTTGQTFLLNPRANALGQLTLSAHGPGGCSISGARLFVTLDPPPAPPAERAVWIAEVFRTHFLPDPPMLTILWLCEPDTTGHYSGLGSAAQYAALRLADAAFGRILDDWQAGPHRDSLQIMLASDHGHATITGHQDVRAALPDFADCLLLPGSSAGFVVLGAVPDRIAALAHRLTRQDWAGAVYAADNADLPAGVLPRSALLADHRRAAHVLFTLRASQAASPAGLPGVTLLDGGLEVGAGSHGGLLPAELHTVLMLAGSRIRPGLSEHPAGLIDIAPTTLTLLGLPGAETMDGRILTEALDGTPPEAAAAMENWEARDGAYAQCLTRTRLGRHLYLDGGYRL